MQVYNRKVISGDIRVQPISAFSQFMCYYTNSGMPMYQLDICEYLSELDQDQGGFKLRYLCIPLR